MYNAAAEHGVEGANMAEMLDNLVLWWRERHSLPAWRKFAHRMFLMQPSSASVERVFSILTGVFGKQQSQSISDYIETTLMLKCNFPDTTPIREV